MIVHLITGLNVGGAELALLRLLEGLEAQERTQHSVISLITPGPVGKQVEALGVQVDTLNMQPGRITPGGLIKLLKLLQGKWHLQCWMYHANLLGALACILKLRPRNLVWCVHNSLSEMKREKKLTALVIRLSALFSYLPQHIVYVAKRSAQHHEAIGYARARTLVIPNGYDVAAYAPGSDAALRALVATTAPLIAHVGRWDWSKDHANFIAALAQVPNAHGVLMGKDVDAGNAELMALIAKHNVADRIHLLGYRSDVPQLLAGADLLCLSSLSEAQPNAVGEAMACGVACVVTDVGDAADLVGDTGWVVPPANSGALAQALNTALTSDYKARGVAARARILAQYTRETMVASWRNLYAQLHWTGEKNAA